MSSPNVLSEPPESQFYTFQEARKLLGVNEKTLRKALKDKRIPFIRLGAKTIRIPKKVIDELANSGFEEMRS